jgi:transcriptional regulator with XRE-family HTH domain
MKQIEVGAFITQCRKEKKLTQAQLAEKLNITDRAVSKWETGKSMPDSSIMLELCEILGITVNELLMGEREKRESYEEKGDENLDTIDTIKKRKNRVGFKRLGAVIFSALLFTAMAVCFICDMAISGRLTWSLISAVSIVFGWAVCLPGIRFGKKGIVRCFGWLSGLIIPYLYVLSRLINVREVFTVGGTMAVISVAFLWMVIGVFKKMWSGKKRAVFGTVCLVSALFVVTVNVVLSQMTGSPVFNVWDGITVLVLLVSAGVSFGLGGQEEKAAGESLDGREPVEY